MIDLYILLPPVAQTLVHFQFQNCSSSGSSYSLFFYSVWEEWNQLPMENMNPFLPDSNVELIHPDAFDVPCLYIWTSVEPGVLSVLWGADTGCRDGVHSAKDEYNSAMYFYLYFISIDSTLM